MTIRGNSDKIFDQLSYDDRAPRTTGAAVAIVAAFLWIIGWPAMAQVAGTAPSSDPEIRRFEKAVWLHQLMEPPAPSATPKGMHEKFVPRELIAAGRGAEHRRGVEDHRGAEDQVEAKRPAGKSWQHPVRSMPKKGKTFERLVRAWNEQPSAAALHEATRLALSTSTGELGGVPEPPALEKARGPYGDRWTKRFYGVETDYGIHFSGRATQLSRAYDPQQQLETLWLGTSGGGLYKAVSLGVAAFWTPISWTLPGSPSVGAFVVRPSSGEEILIGTGDQWRINGDGIYKTTDGGASWGRVDFPAIPSSVYRLQVDRDNDDVVLAATRAGLFRSEDFGDTWEELLPNWSSDVLQDPMYPDSWYATVAGVGIVQSGDGGRTFEEPVAPCTQIPGPIGRAELAVSEAAPNFVYAVVSDGVGYFNGIYRSENYGCTWSTIDPRDTNSWKMAEVALAIAVDPTDPNLLFVGSGGGQLTENATSSDPCWYRNVNSGVVSDCGLPLIDVGHADQTHALFDGDHLLITSDGGAFQFDWRSPSVVDLGNDLGLSSLQTDSSFKPMAVSSVDQDLLVAGFFDNGTAHHRPGTLPAQMFIGGDGGVVSLSAHDMDKIFFSAGIPYERMASWNLGTSIFDLQCFPDELGWAGVHADPTRDRTPGEEYIFTFGLPEAGSEEFFVWFKPETTRACDWLQAHEEPLPFEHIGLDVSHDAEGWRLYVTGKGQRLLVLEGEPGTMTQDDRTPPGFSSLRLVRALADRSEDRPGTAYYTGQSTGNKPHAFVSDDGGADWREVTGNLPELVGNVPIYEMLADPRYSSTLIVGTYLGVYRTDTGHDESPEWFRYMAGMPAVSQARNLEVYITDDEEVVLQLGTYGHGIWQRKIEPWDPGSEDDPSPGSAQPEFEQ